MAISFTGDEVQDYYRLIELVGEETAQQAIKKLIHEALEKH